MDNKIEEMRVEGSEQMFAKTLVSLGARGMLVYRPTGKNNDRKKILSML